MLEELLRLPIEEKIGQLFFVGLPGAELDENTIEFLREISPGGVCLFARNIKTAEQTRNLLDGVRETLAFEPFLSVDEEGGTVDRLRRIVSPLPSANSIKTVEDAQTLARITAEILRMLGFNMNFAPVVDVIDERRAKSSNGLYSRAFGSSGEETAKLAKVYLETLQGGGCIGCLKHFPGLGASVSDSHEQLPEVNLTAEEFFECDLFPYKSLIKSSRIEAIMVAHAAFPQLDLQEKDRNGKLLPSSLSYNFVAKLLRRELGFEGLILTDDLEMGAILRNYRIGEACTRAIEAGENMLLICSNLNAAREGYFELLEAVKKEEISETLIDDSLRRIARLKSLIQKPLPLIPARRGALSQNIAEFNQKLNYIYGG